MDDGFDTALAAAAAQVAPRMQNQGGGQGGGAAPSGPSADDPDCPIRPLGHRKGRYRLFDAAGQLRDMSEDKLQTSGILLSLMGGQMRWACGHFPQLDREGQPTGWFSARALGAWIVARCHEAGLYADSEPVRDIGVWRARGVTLVHLGEVVWSPADRRGRRAGFRDYGALWPAVPRALPAPEEAGAQPLPPPASAATARDVEGVFARWTWEQGYAPAVITGLYAAGLLGAAIRWRPHGMICGGAGTGKTTLMDTIAALSPLAAGWDDYTEPGLRQALNGRAAPVLLDEAEGDDQGTNKLYRVVELLRRATGGIGARTVKGSPGGMAQHFEVNAQALMGAILPPVLMPQDESRFTRVDLRQPPDPADLGEDAPPPLPDEAELLRLRALAPALLARALAGAERMAENLALYRGLILQRGCPPRQADQVGSILAARRMMLQDHAALESEARADIAGPFAALVAPPGQAAMEDGAGAVLMHLLQSRADVLRSGERPSFAVLLRRAMTHEGDDDRRVLQAHGLGVAPWPRGSTDTWHLFIANTHPALAKVFEGTRWSGGRWKEDLRRLPGAVRPEGGCRECGPEKPRCTAVPAPLAPWGRGDSEEGVGM